MLKIIALDCITGTIVREVSGIHRNGFCTSFDISYNNKYIVTSGEDKMIKVWDYEMPGIPPVYQAFIGHDSSVNKIIFSQDNIHVFSIGDDAMFIWKFLGDLSPMIEELQEK